MRTKHLIPALIVPLALAACGAEAPAPAPTEAVDVPAAADAPAGVSLTAAEVRMPAVTGRPGVAYFTIASEDPRTIVGVSVMGAGRAEMHQTTSQDGKMSMALVEEIALQPGEPIAFQSGGYHAMLFDMDATIAPGGTTDLTITFANGDKASIAANVVPAGGMAEDDMANGDMAGMDH
ncbi:copper chaperone PCu(A)C [Croceicoccus naphthovorans]|uniref:copper chaperone PCu(A)C n=1 Tax=Croceicoccus naphthovorans TaxID=1348774 RepID=UPI00069EF3CC|nr:copper chaperone PCu(A)C [Croceicoccus naphthovorans]MBB3991107.1 hypothetical protein [Croceicoccus naphthovorans]